jgi:elongation factor P hydroxylase
LRAVATLHHDALDLEALFDALFRADHRTVLRGGFGEPLYRPPGADEGVLGYRDDHFASALHEVAHWCIAGSTRRTQVDFGYAYEPDGRDEAAQRAFEAVEARPQAIEWLFADACGSRFVPSPDNLHGGPAPPARFAAAIDEARTRLVRDGLPPRAAAFRDLLRARYCAG